MKRVRKAKAEKQTLEQYLAGWREAMTGTFDDDAIELFLAVKKKQYQQNEN